jgi:hypothetical protein
MNNNTSRDIIIEEISVDSVNKDTDADMFNSCNHWTTGPPDDYKEVVDKTLTKEWIDEFRTFYSVINIDASDLRWMKEASNLYFHTARISKLHHEDIDSAASKYNKLLGHLFNGTKYFVRADNVSLKEGMHGVGPYTTIKQIIESLITCKSSHTPIYEGVTHIKLYLLPWVDISPDKEFRVFVYNNNITAISQQHLYVTNSILAKIDSDEEKRTLVKHWVDSITDYFDRYVKNRIKTESCCMDIALTDNVYFIEINPFGKEYSAGSSLFHWIIDENKLYGDGDHIYCRYAL